VVLSDQFVHYRDGNIDLRLCRQEQDSKY